ncbi:MAG TPA: hypothetical protein VH933_04030 [Aestuariivirgaceae bacterium]|jgi:hypothetical protein
MYAKIASALLISAVLLTPVAALGAGGNFGPKPLTITKANPHVDAKGPLILSPDEIVQEVWTWIYQPSTGASQVYYQIGPLTVANTEWHADQKHTSKGKFEAGHAFAAAMLFDAYGNKLHWWWDQFDLVEEE